ncbi:MAG: hypothetical protein ABIT37_14830 [Luteolibacter sp.]
MSIFKPVPTQPNTPVTDPAAHGALTIGEQIESMRRESADCPGESCFMNTRGKRCWITNGVVERFVRNQGATYPSDYRSANGVEWQSLFFRGI